MSYHDVNRPRPRRASETRCQYMYRNLLSFPAFGNSPNSSTIYVREILTEMDRCYEDPTSPRREKLVFQVSPLYLSILDSAKPADELFKVRLAYSMYLINHGDAGAEDRIKQFNSTERDKAVATAAVLHYRTWTMRVLRQRLDWKNSVQYWLSFPFGK